MTWDTGEYAYLPNGPSDYGPVWSVEEVYDVLTPEDTEGASPAELVVSLDSHRGHYLTADWITAVADLIDEAPGDVRGVDRTAKFDALRADAEAASEVYAMRVHDADDDVLDYIVSLSDEVESVIAEAGYITDWNDSGVCTFLVKALNDA